jgi:1,3-beta-glucanosyltransferase GAS1
MKAFADANIYILTALSGPKSTVIDGDAPQWNTDLYDYYTSVIDSMQNYTNVLGFFVGNEVAYNSSTSSAMAFVKAAARDMKAYIKANNYRSIPVGYSTNDDADIREPLAAYMNCGDDAVDFLGYNVYSWCGLSSFIQSGYGQLTGRFANYSIPVFLSEYGCNLPSPRNFTEVQAIYGDKMTDTFSGGIVYQYFDQPTGFGKLSLFALVFCAKSTPFLQIC